MDGVISFPKRQERPYVSKAAIAKRYEVSFRTIDRWVGQGLPKHKTRSGRARFVEAECDAWVFRHNGVAPSLLWGLIDLPADPLVAVMAGVALVVLVSVRRIAHHDR